MATIIIYEVKDGKPLAMYGQKLTAPESGHKDEVFIHMRAGNGKSQLIAIPVQDWREFMRNCRKMSAVLSS